MPDNRVTTMKTLSFILIALLMGPGLLAQVPKKSIYHDTWIDLNKNGRMDVYEDPKATIDRRVEDLLSQMNLDEKTCQTATLYGVGRGRTGGPLPLKDQFTTPDLENQNLEDGISDIGAD